MSAIRLIWTEERYRESEPQIYFMIADIVGKTITLAEQPMWDVCWFECELTPSGRRFVKKTLSRLRGRRDQWTDVTFRLFNDPSGRTTTVRAHRTGLHTDTGASSAPYGCDEPATTELVA